MKNVFLCVVIVLLILWLFAPALCNLGCDSDNLNFGFATAVPELELPSRQEINTGGSENDYNNYLQNMALDSSIKEQHKEWTENLQVNLQPRMYSIRDDCDDGETPRVGLLKKDYGNIINENQNISVPSGRTCTEGDGGNSRFGGYGLGLCPVQRSI
jgi:hypothetical protein